MRKICKERETRENFIGYKAAPKLEMCYVGKGRDI
jgi:hypothetical protein